MKTSSSARKVVKIRRFALCLVFVASVGFAFGLGETVATRVGQSTARQTESPQAPSVSLGELLAATR